MKSILLIIQSLLIASQLISWNECRNMPRECAHNNGLKCLIAKKDFNNQLYNQFEKIKLDLISKIYFFLKLNKFYSFEFIN